MAYITSEPNREQLIPSKDTWIQLSLSELYDIETKLLEIVRGFKNKNVARAYEIHLSSLRALISAKEYQSTLPSSDE